MSSVAVVGGGPAGMLAAAAAGRHGHTVTLFEKNEKLGRKLYLTGKGRCNITNNADISDFFAQIARNPKFMYSAFHGFDNRDMVALLEDMGVPTKVERGGRVFPASDRSSDVIRALAAYLRQSGATVRLNAAVTDIQKADGGFSLTAGGEIYLFDNVVLCTGGASYPATGSTGDGYAFASALGHTVTPIAPSLVPLETEEAWPAQLQGLSLRNVTLRAFRGKKLLFEDLGEMLFTHYGVSGPLVLHAVSRFAEEPAGVLLKLDLKPGLTEEQLDRRILRDFEKYTNRRVGNALCDLLPLRMTPVVIELAGLSGETSVHEVTRPMRAALCTTLKHMELHVKKARPMEEAIITRGGIAVKEIDASTMESRLVPGLYFAGEVIDVDAATGGYNLQIACSTGVLAGSSIT